MLVEKFQTVGNPLLDIVNVAEDVRVVSIPAVLLAHIGATLSEEVAIVEEAVGQALFAELLRAKFGIACLQVVKPIPLRTVEQSVEERVRAVFILRDKLREILRRLRV